MSAALSAAADAGGVGGWAAGRAGPAGRSAWAARSSRPSASPDDSTVGRRTAAPGALRLEGTLGVVRRIVRINA
ncbi:hypothetical protein OG436_21650 [Streptomyces caniferus]|uniref:hypothetical protein n=1 Tax=Streptomyces caniferus TaxID=285557 RepID=UPI002E2E1204|nr:hypothetical protein [Streptomyces caniferus]